MNKDSSNNSIKIANINNLTINNTLTTDGNNFYVRGNNIYISIDVNNDMNFINCSKLPFFACQEVDLGTNVIDFKVGNDISISGTSNLIYNKFNSTINLEAGNDIVINGTSETSPPILAYDGATENYKAKHDFIINSLTASFAINNNSTGTVTVENDIKISSLNVTGISVITNGIGNFTANGDIIENAKSNPISGKGSSEGSMDALSIYNTWLGDKNHYLDIVGKIGRMRGNSTYEDSLFPEKGDYESKFYSLSGEYGRNNINKNGYYHEPQVQLTLGKISGNDYTTSSGTKVSQDGITSLLGRVGVTFGKEFNQDNPAKHSNVYAKVNYLHEFKGDSTTNLTDAYGDSFGPTTDFGGSWWNLGIGTTLNLNKGTHLYADLEKNFGGEVNTNWLAQVGCRWT